VPKETFLNLPEAKRQAVIDAAVDEFAAYPYEQASVNRIVANAGIAKGSFYQYFNGKKDLFFYLISLIAADKIHYLSAELNNPTGHDFYTLMHELFLSGARFALDRPRYAAIANRLLAEKDGPIFRELQAESRPISFAVFQPLIRQAISRGEIRDDVDVTILNYIITSLSVSIVEYCSGTNPDGVFDAVVEIVDTFMDVLKNGIGTQSAGPQLKAES
jgi:AcrR family transcriptional regulator